MIVCDPDRISFDGKRSLAHIVSVLNDYATHGTTLYLQRLRKGTRINSLLPRLFDFDGWCSLHRIYITEPFGLLQNEPISYQEATSIFRMCSKLVQLSIFASEDTCPVTVANHDLVIFSAQLRGSSAVLGRRFFCRFCETWGYTEFQRLTSHRC